MRKVLVLLALLAVATLPQLDAPRDSPFVLESFRVPARGYRLSVTVLRPRGDGPFGAVVLNHGVAASAEGRRRESPALLLHAAAEFARRGYAVVMPLRRGFGRTGGEFAEDAGSCRSPDYRRGERAAARDVLAAYAFARTLPYVDGSRMILAGQSAGGVAALYAATQSPPGLRAVVTFAAGRGADDSAPPGVPCAADRLAALFEDMGRAIKVPALLYYAANDRYFGPATSRQWFARLKESDASAELVMQPAFGDNGHYVFSDPAGAALWLPRVADFFRRHRIPFEPPRQSA